MVVDKCQIELHSPQTQSTQRSPGPQPKGENRITRRRGDAEESMGRQGDGETRRRGEGLVSVSPRPSLSVSVFTAVTLW